jgi:hypothetical protein
MPWVFLFIFAFIVMSGGCGGGGGRGADNGGSPGGRGLAVSPSSLSLRVGESAMVTVSNYYGAIVWMSMTPSIATVTPTGAATARVTASSAGTALIGANDGNGYTAYCEVTVTAVSGPTPGPTPGPIIIAPTIDTAALQDGVVGTAYSQTLSASGSAPITWGIESGVLPYGLSLNVAIGEISGTPTSAGTSTFTVKAANAAGSAQKSLSIVVTAASAPPVINTSSLLGGTIGVPYSQTLDASGTTPIYWTSVGDDLPYCLRLNVANG